MRLSRIVLKRTELRPIPEHALASAERLHPCSARVKTIVDCGFLEILDGIDDELGASRHRQVCGRTDPGVSEQRSKVTEAGS
jgi:hypothetical protein